jgi:glycosyltransferase involved in cell wall biosynthesis
VGAGVTAPTGLDNRVVTLTTGSVGPEQLASSFAAGDIFLGAFIDGVSTRRTSVMTALQHGMATVATDGVWTDTVFRRSPESIRLVPAGHARRFALEVVRLARSAEDRQALGCAGRSLYERVFDWPVVTQQLLTGMDLV